MKFLKHTLDSLAPGMGLLLRHLKEQRRLYASPVETPFGYSLTGPDMMTRGSYQPEETKVFLKYLDAADVCVDVGANVGFYSCLAASRGKHVVAVEPIPANAELLLRNLGSNGFSHVEVYPMALGAEASIHPMYGGGTGASLVPGWAGIPRNFRRFVPITTLDTILENRFNNQRILVKIDVEGFEWTLLQGAMKTLSREPRPAWLIEICLNTGFPGSINPRFRDTFELFWSCGYQARSPDQSERPIEKSDIECWVSRGESDFAAANYLFV
jgi:FkbM family methyltransferase